MPEVELLLTGYTFGSDQGRFGFSTVVLVRGRQNILVDTGPTGRREVLLEALRKRGLSPQDIGMVVLTHAHWDHCQNPDLFPRATLVLHPAELDYARSPHPKDWATFTLLPELLKGRSVREVREGDEIEPGVRVIETPGHTKGHISVLVETNGGPVVIAGDAFPAPLSLALGKPYLIFWDEGQAEESLKKLLSLSHTFFPGHDRPFRLGEGDQVEYLGGDLGLRVVGNLGHGYGEVSIHIAPAPPRTVTIVR